MQYLDKDSLATTEFYQRRRQNFATLALVPAGILLVFGILFMLMAKKEVTVRSTGELTPLRYPVSIQATTTSKLVENRLQEGRFVHQGDTLLIYHDVSNPAQAKVYADQERRNQAQLTALTTLQQGVTTNQNTFKQADDFGYSDILQDYLNQRQIYSLTNAQTAAEQRTRNSKTSQVGKLLAQSIQNIQANIDAATALLNAINSGKAYPGSGRYAYLYTSFQTESKGLTGDALTKVKSSYASQIQEQRSNQQDNLSTLQLQQANNADADTSQYAENQVADKLASLQSEQLKNVATLRNQTEEALQTVQAKLTVLKDQTKDFHVQAPTSGTLHLDTAVGGKQYVPTGTTLAEIYPVIREQKTVKVVVPVSPADVMGVRSHQTIRLRISRNVPTPLILTGKVSKIDVAPTVTKSGNYFSVTAVVPLKDIKGQQLAALHYGMLGQASIITGTKTYWQNLVDQLLDRS